MSRTSRELPPGHIIAVVSYSDPVNGHAQTSLMCASPTEFRELQEWVMNPSRESGLKAQYYALAKDFPALAVLDKTMRDMQ